MDPTDPTTTMEEELDSEITSIRAEIHKLQRRRRFLSSSILSSDTLQKRLGGSSQTSAELALSNPLFTLDADISPLVRAAGNHTQSNHHRIAFSTTTFPFKDPSPTTAGNPNLLGVRIDVCAGNGRFVKPYYLLLKRMERDNEKTVRVHRHTIPAFIPMERLEQIFLPYNSSSTSFTAGPVDGEEVSLRQIKTKNRARNTKQDLRGLVREVRRQLVGWHSRMDAVHYLRGQLGVIRRGVDAYDDGEEDGPWERNMLPDSTMGETRLAKNDLRIIALSSTALEAAYVRLEWEDGRVGRFKISSSGLVERAVVIGDSGRDKALEAAMTGGDRKVVTVLDRLRKYRSSRSGNMVLDRGIRSPTV